MCFGGPLLGPYQLVGQPVWARVHGEELVVVHAAPPAPPRSPATACPPRPPADLDPAHYPERTTDPLDPRPKPASLK